MMKQDDRDLTRQVAALTVLLSSGEGIRTKAPSYILEKYLTCTALEPEFLPNILDKSNEARYNEWLKTWKAYLE